MIKRRKFPGVFFGWWTVLAGGIISLWGAAPYYYGMSALFKPISTELGFSRASASVPTAIGRFEGGFEAPLTGWLTDRFGPRWIIIFGVFLLGLSLVLMYYVDSLWSFFVVWGILLGTGTNIGLSIPIDKAITDWFVKKRGKALGIKWVGSGLSGVLVLPFIAWLITVQGWRVTCLVTGIIMWVIGLPLAWFFFKPHRPEYYGLLPDGASSEEELAEESQMLDRGVAYASEVEEVEFTLRQALKTPTYWLLIIAHAVHSLVMSGFNIHLIPFLTDTGIDPLVAAGMMTIMVFASIPFRFIGGYIADRLKKNHLRLLMGGAYFMEALGFGVFMLNQGNVPAIYLWLILYGIGMGTGFVFSTIAARYFGRKAFGSIHGSRMLFMAPFSVAAPIYAGWVYDTTGSYLTVFTIFTVALTFASVLMSVTFPPRPPAQAADIREIM